jgi:hypothetical protein
MLYIESISTSCIMICNVGTGLHVLHTTNVQSYINYIYCMYTLQYFGYVCMYVCMNGLVALWCMHVLAQMTWYAWKCCGFCVPRKIRKIPASATSYGRFIPLSHIAIIELIVYNNIICTVYTHDANCVQYVHCMYMCAMCSTILQSCVSVCDLIIREIIRGMREQWSVEISRPQPRVSTRTEIFRNNYACTRWLMHAWQSLGICMAVVTTVFSFYIF